MKYVIYNKHNGEKLRARARSVGMFVESYKSESAAKAALTRLDKKGQLGGLREWNEDIADFETNPWVKEDFLVADVETWREAFPVKMVQKRNALTGKMYWEADDTPRCCSPSSELYWSM